MDMLGTEVDMYALAEDGAIDAFYDSFSKYKKCLTRNCKKEHSDHMKRCLMSLNNNRFAHKTYLQLNTHLCRNFNNYNGFYLS